MKFRRRREQCLQVNIGFSDRVTEKRNGRGVCIDFPIAFSYYGRPSVNRVAEFARPIMSVHSNAKLVASWEIAGFGRSDAMVRRRFLDGGPLHARKRLTHDETELRIKRKGPIVVGHLHQTDACKLPF